MKPVLRFGSFLLAIAPALAIAQPPPRALAERDVAEVTLSRPPKPPEGKNIALTIHLTSAARKKGGLPPSIAVTINDKTVEAQDLTGSGTYTVFGSAPDGDLPAAPEFLMRSTGSGTHPNPKIKWKCFTITCPPGCKGIIFGGPCVVCIKCKIGGDW